MRTSEEIKEIIANSKKVDAERAFYKKEQAEKVISARNQIAQIAKYFQAYCIENQSKLVNKKLFLTVGGRSKVLDTFFDGFKSEYGIVFENRGLQWCFLEKGYNYTKFEISICVNGGLYSEKSEFKISTNYTTYVRDSFLDIIKVDDDNKFVEVETKPIERKAYSYEAYEAAKLKISVIEKEIELMNNKISELKKDIPSELR